MPSGWHRWLALAPELADFARRGFRTRPVARRQVLEHAASTFLAGFNAELAVPPGQAPQFPELAPPLRGFAVEGAAMAATVLDLARPGRPRRLPALLEAHGAQHVHLVHVGAGWAMAKLRWRGWWRLSYLDPLLRWLAHDGWGFARGFFATAPGLDRYRRHRWPCTPACAIRFQGLGRSLWFRECGSAAGLESSINALPVWHRGDAWSGVGLAASYAGGASATELACVRDTAAGYHEHLAQGAAFASEAWRRAGHVPAHARTAVAVLAEADVETAAGWTQEAMAGLCSTATATTYQLWRGRVQRLTTKRA